MLVPSEELWQELLRTPGFARVVLVVDKAELTPALVIKATSLSLRYLLATDFLRFAVFRVGAWTAYAVGLNDGNPPAVVYSLIETADEKRALSLVATGTACQVHLFSEACVNVASAVDFRVPPDEELARLIEASELHPAHDTSAMAEVAAELDRMGPDGLSLSGVVAGGWSKLSNILVTESGAKSELDLLDGEEGTYQEELALWLTDHLDPGRVLMRPQIVQHGKQRELCDILLSYHGGSILIESKALGFSSRRKLASRDELAQDCRKHVRKAERQLRGAWRQIKSGAIVTDREGVTYEVERTAPPHCIILVPDLSLLSGEGSAEGIYLVAKFGQDLQGFLHLLDPSSLLRTSQAAAMLSAAGTSTTPMMAFDAWLIERWNKAIELGQVDFDVRLTIGP